MAIDQTAVSSGFQAGMSYPGRYSSIAEALKKYNEDAQARKLEQMKLDSTLESNKQIYSMLEGQGSADGLSTGLPTAGAGAKAPTGFVVNPNLAFSRSKTTQAFIKDPSLTLGTKESQQQDKLEQNALQRMSSIRGDASLARIEQQRDASIQAYSIVAKAEKENRVLNQAEYTDLLGQLWRARTGSAPTNQVMEHLTMKTAQGKLGEVFTYVTGRPAPATTEEIVQALKEFIVNSGQTLDAQHSAYMKSRLTKPAGLADERWEPMVKAGRGMSFEDAVQQFGAQPAAGASTGGVDPELEKALQAQGVDPSQL